MSDRRTFMKNIAAIPALAGPLSHELAAASSSQSAASPAAPSPQMEIRVIAKNYPTTFSRMHPVLLRIKPGDTVVTKTIDCLGFDDKGVQFLDFRKEGNALTGPFFVEGAEPDDAMLVHLRKIQMNRNWGLTLYRLNLCSLTPDAVENIYSDKTKPDLAIKGNSSLVPWDLDVTRQMVRLREPHSQRVEFEFAAQPMLGCIGVAAAGDSAPTSVPAGYWGGNLDYKEVRESATVVLPVNHPGGLLFLGDGHALQAEGETLGCGIETSMDVEFSVDLRKDAKLTGPRLDTDEYIISIGAQPEFGSSVDRALQMATTDMIRWLTDEYKLEPWAAHILVGTQGRYDVITVAGSAALRIHKRYLPSK